MTTSPVMSLTDELVAELDHLASEATGGDWEFRLCEIRANQESDGYTVIAEAPTVPKNWRDQRDTNMRYIATASPAVIQTLLRERAEMQQHLRAAMISVDNCELFRKDAERLDWLADPENTIGNVQLPTDCVLQNVHSLRAAIDAAMQLEQKQ